MLVAREYRSLSEVRSLVGDGLSRAHAPCLFDRLDWLESLHRHCFGRLPVRAFHAEGEVGAQAWMFLVARDARRVAALANWYSFSWNPIFLGNPDREAQRTMLTAIARLMKKDVAMADFYPVTLDDGMAPLFMGAFRAAGWIAFRRAYGARYDLELSGRDFAHYWAERPGQLRTTIKRKAHRTPLNIRIADSFSADDWHAYVAIHARSWKEPDPGLPFLRALAEREGAAGALRFGFAELHGKPIATQLWTIDHGRALIHKLAHDRAHDSLSPGTLLGHAMFAHAIDSDGVTRIDYGTGDNSYKADWMERREVLWRVDCFNPRFASSWLPSAKTAISALVG